MDVILSVQGALASATTLSALAPSGSKGATPLHQAASSSQVGLCRLICTWLLAAGRGAQLDTPDDSGRTPLHIACARLTPLPHATAVVSILLEAGASVHARDKAGRAPLHIAALTANVRGLPLLMAAGADVDAPDDRGETPLALAAGEAHPAAVSALLSYGADPAARDEEGITPAGRLLAKGPGEVDAGRRRQVLALLGQPGTQPETAGGGSVGGGRSSSGNARSGSSGDRGGPQMVGTGPESLSASYTSTAATATVTTRTPAAGISGMLYSYVIPPPPDRGGGGGLTISSPPRGGTGTGGAGGSGRRRGVGGASVSPLPPGMEEPQHQQQW